MTIIIFPVVFVIIYIIAIDFAINVIIVVVVVSVIVIIIIIITIFFFFFFFFFFYFFYVAVVFFFVLLFSSSSPHHLLPPTLSSYALSPQSDRVSLVWSLTSKVAFCTAATFRRSAPSDRFQEFLHRGESIIYSSFYALKGPNVPDTWAVVFSPFYVITESPVSETEKSFFFPSLAFAKLC